MYRYVGVVRDKEELEKAEQDISDMREQAKEDLKIVPGKIFNYDQIHAFELFNMLELCDAVVEAALLRQESRGAHYRSDYAKSDNKQWLQNIIAQHIDGKLSLRTEKVKAPYVKLPEGESDE